ncbi:MAG: hypothetical protein Q9221_000435 [Calogaya cf. arnoldii]
MIKKEKQPDAKRRRLDTNDDSSRGDCHWDDHPLVPSFEYTTLVKITVGPEKTFYAYKEQLCSKSDFFNAACHGAFQESNGTVDLPEQDPDIVNYFIHWISTGTLRGLYNPTLTPKKLWQLKQAAAAEEPYRHYNDKDWSPKQKTALDMANYRDLPLQQLISLYTFADFAQVKGLKDAIIDAVVDAYGRNPVFGRFPKAICIWDLRPDKPDWLPDPIELINSAWEQLPADTPFRRVLTNLFCDAVSQISNTRYARELCPAFEAAAFDLIMARVKSRKDVEDWMRQERVCEFHCHDVPCSKQ